MGFDKFVSYSWSYFSSNFFYIKSQAPVCVCLLLVVPFFPTSGELVGYSRSTPILTILHFILNCFVSMPS